MNLIQKIFFLIIIFIAINNTCLYAKTNTPATNKDKIKQETLDFWRDTFKFGTSNQKIEIINYIKSKKISTGENLILEFIKQEENEKVKKLMISTLVVFSNTKVLPYILEITKKTNSDEMIIFAFSQLSKLKYKDSYKYVMNYIDSENEYLVEAALRTLGNTQAKAVVDKLLEKLKNENNERIRTQLILTLVNIKSEKTQNTLISIFTNKEEKELNRGYAVTGLGYIKNRRSYDILIKYYESESSNIKMRIIDALGNLGYKDAVNLIIESLKDEEKNIRIYGIRALGKLKAENAIDILKYKEKYDPDFKVKKEAKKVLEELEGEK